MSINRTDSSAAMSSLLGAYTGSDEEDESMNKGEDFNISDEDDDTPKVKEEPPAQPEKRTLSPAPDPNPKPPKMKKRATKLVSYGADDIDEDDDDVDDDIDNEGDEQSQKSPRIKSPDSEDESPDRDEIFGIDVQSSLNTEDASSLSRKIQSLKDADKIRIPPEPPGNPSRTTMEKIRKLEETMKRGRNLKNNIKNRKDFRNPSIYEKLIIMLGIDEKGTNYPPEIYNTSIWGPDSYYDELAKIQKVEMDKREKERKERTKVEFVVGTKKSDGGDQKRKSKWDAQPPASVSGSKPTVITTSAVNPPVVSVTTSATGSKTTVISSIGTIKKSR